MFFGVATRLLTVGSTGASTSAPPVDPSDLDPPASSAAPIPATAPAAAQPFAVTAVSMFDANDDPDAAEPALEKGVNPIIVLVTDLADRPLAGVPVVLLSAKADGPTLAGPRYTKSDGRARFPTDLALEREGDVVVAARALPGTAVWGVVKAALDRPAEVALKVEPGLAAAVRLFDPDGAPHAGRARVRKVVVDEPAPEPGDRGPQLTAAFREATPRSARVGDGFRFVGLAPGETFTLYAWAEGYEAAFQTVQVPELPPRPLPIDATLGRRLASVTFVAATPPPLEAADVAFGCRSANEDELVVLAGADARPTQRVPGFRLDVAPGASHRLRVEAYVRGEAEAAAEIEIPTLRAGETYDAGVVRLAPLGVVVAGRVVDPEGRPIAGAAVEVVPAGGGRELTAETDAAGAFDVQGLPGRGPYHVSVHAGGRVAERRTDVVEGTKDLRVALDPAGAIAGRVILPAGGAPEHVRVRALRPDRPPSATSLAADGSFHLGELAAGVYVLVLDGPEIRTLRVGDVVVTPPETNAEDRLQRLAPAAASRGQP